MNLLFIGCSHLAGSWDNPYQVDIQTSIIGMLARKFPQHHFDVHAFPGHGLLTFEWFLKKLSMSYDRVVFIGDYNRLGAPAETTESELILSHSNGNFKIQMYRVVQFYTIFPPNCLDPKPYKGDYRNLIASFDDTYLDRKTHLITQLLQENLSIPCVDWIDIWRTMEHHRIDVRRYWTHPTDMHFGVEGNTLALPFVEQKLKELNVL